jgi:hypothetical protein
MPASLQRHNPAADSAGLTVMTYNVRAFDLYGYLDTTHTRDIRGEVYRFVHGQQPDVLCVQEYHFADKRPKALRSVLDMAGIPYDSTRSLQSQVYGLVNGSGVVTVSRYPIVNRGILEFPGSGNMTIYTDIVRGADTFRVYNCHLHSFGLRKAETDLLDTISLGGVEEKTDFLIRIGHRMREGFLRRAAQVEQVADHVGQSPYPVVCAGISMMCLCLIPTENYPTGLKTPLLLPAPVGGVPILCGGSFRFGLTIFSTVTSSGR